VNIYINSSKLYIIHIAVTRPSTPVKGWSEGQLPGAMHTPPALDHRHPCTPEARSSIVPPTPHLAGFRQHLVVAKFNEVGQTHDPEEAAAKTRASASCRSSLSSQVRLRLVPSAYPIALDRAAHVGVHGVLEVVLLHIRHRVG
jgi:hypothetical protein